MDDNINVVSQQQNMIYKPVISSPITLELKNGETVNLSLSLRKVYTLKNKNKELYEKYNKALMSEVADLFNFITIIYTAYICENIDKTSNLLSYDEFIDICPSDMETIGDISEKLMAKKKKENL